jgi:hypothetical protein
VLTPLGRSLTGNNRCNRFHNIRLQLQSTPIALAAIENRLDASNDLPQTSVPAEPAGSNSNNVAEPGEPNEEIVADDDDSQYGSPLNSPSHHPSPQLSGQESETSRQQPEFESQHGQLQQISINSQNDSVTSALSPTAIPGVEDVAETFRSTWSHRFSLTRDCCELETTLAQCVVDWRRLTRQPGETAPRHAPRGGNSEGTKRNQSRQKQRIRSRKRKKKMLQKAISSDCM